MKYFFIYTKMSEVGGHVRLITGKEWGPFVCSSGETKLTALIS